MLHVPIRLGQNNDKRIVLVHGFTQCGDVWESLSLDLARAGYEVLAPDLPGHGLTDAKYDSADLWEAARLLRLTCGNAMYVGYSLGARVVMHAAVKADVERAILVGAKAGFRNPDERCARKAADDALADRIESLGSEGRLEVFIDEWLHSPVNARLDDDATFRDLRLANRAEGLASSLRNCGSGAQQPLWDRLREIEIPVLLTFGEFDFPAVLQDSSEIAFTIGRNARQLLFNGTGHSIPFEKKAEFERAVLGFADDQKPDHLGFAE